MRTPLLAALPLVFAALFLGGCGEEGTVLVTVGEGAVTVEELQRSAGLMGDKGFQQTQTPEGRQQLLERAIQIEVLHQAALAAGIDELPDVQTQLEQAARDVLISNFLRISFANYGFGEEELFSYYQAHSGELVSPPQASVRHIVTDSRKDAERVLADLAAGADFSRLATERSQDRMSAVNGGRLPVVSADNQVLPVSILEAIFAAEAGRPIGPLESRMGWHVLVVDAFNPGQPLSFDEAKQQIVLELLAPEPDVRAYYDEHAAEFDRPDSVSLRYILTATRQEAERVLARAAAGEDFSALAREVSLDAATKANGGLIPQLYRGRPLPLFAGSADAEIIERTAFSLAPGRRSEPFELSRGWAVIELGDFTPGRDSTYEEAHTQVRARLFETRVREREERFYDSLTQELGLERNEEAISAFITGQ
ncbi:MAG TPA: hypothetical protein ENN88_04455 [Candidatus Coatesbacteria bacterium]|nr:hypothetical protein [Candidatus Coatesbacteria bacterium]